MGWFWADTTQSFSRSQGQDGRLSLWTTDDAGSPPPGCPMHQPSSSLQKATEPLSNSSCTYISSTDNTTTTKTNNRSSASLFSRINPLNRMPEFISQERAPGQSIILARERELSSIPKGSLHSGDSNHDNNSPTKDSGNWEYPSPQQMYNAMLRKGYTDTPEDAVESMVAVHNFLNEGAWSEIVEWERRFCNGLWSGWRECCRGEAPLPPPLPSSSSPSPPSSSQSPSPSPSSYAATPSTASSSTEPPRLIRFTGRPDTPTPKASLMQTLAYIMPSRFASEPPFDRHDWFVQRTLPDGRTAEVRYVIDYYSGPPEPTGEPVFYLDVRPAVDTPSAAAARMIRWGRDIWWRASGGEARERKRLETELETLEN